MPIHIRGRSRSKSTATTSYKSHHSQPSSASATSTSSAKNDDVKMRSLLTNPTAKANPNAAINEAQPSFDAFQATTTQALSSVQHFDRTGKKIDEPDLSNPTRYRWERPLDTIRSFQAEIDAEYRAKTKGRRA